MLPLSLSWLGPSPWPPLLLLIGASWLLFQALSWAWAFQDTCRRLRCFPQSPKRSWFWGHLGMVSVAREDPRIQGLGELVMAQENQGSGSEDWE